MAKSGFVQSLVLFAISRLVCGINIVLTNDDGWAERNVRYTFEELSADHNVLLSAPAQDQSGTGSSEAEPKPRTEPCQYNTCEKGAATGNNGTALNWVNSFPATSMKFGVAASPDPVDLVVSGPNVGGNRGAAAFFSGTIGAASVAATRKDGWEPIPAIAFSGDTGDKVSFTESQNDGASRIYAKLTAKLVQDLVANTPQGERLLPEGIMLNVNYPKIDDGCGESTVEFKLTRLLVPIAFESDFEPCDEDDIWPWLTPEWLVGKCVASVSVVMAESKSDAGPKEQEDVARRLTNILKCPGDAGQTGQGKAQFVSNLVQGVLPVVPPANLPLVLPGKSRRGMNVLRARQARGLFYGSLN